MDQDATWCGGRRRPRDIVLDGDPAPSTEMGTAAPTFRPMSIVAKRSPISATTEFLCYLGHAQWRGQKGIEGAEPPQVPQVALSNTNDQAAKTWLQYIRWRFGVMERVGLDLY